MMRKLLSTLALISMSLTYAMAESNTPNLMTIMTTKEPQTQLMAMVLSMQSLKKGANVNILLCGPAGDLALKDAPASATAPQKPKGMSPQGLMRKIINQGGKVDVCAIYLPNKELNIDSLIDEVRSAKPSEMGDKLLSDNTRIMSF